MRIVDGHDPYWIEHRSTVIHFECEGGHDDCTGYSFDVPKRIRGRVPMRIGIARMAKHYRPPTAFTSLPTPDEPPF